MPPFDPRQCPALEVARPRDTTPGVDHGWRDGGRDRRLVLFGDQEWHPVAVLAWWDDNRGRPVVQVEWFADDSTWTEAYRVDQEKMREG